MLYNFFFFFVILNDFAVCCHMLSLHDLNIVFTFNLCYSICLYILFINGGKRIYLICFPSFFSIAMTEIQILIEHV